MTPAFYGLFPAQRGPVYDGSVAFPSGTVRQARSSESVIGACDSWDESWTEGQGKTGPLLCSHPTGDQ